MISGSTRKLISSVLRPDVVRFAKQSKSFYSFKMATLGKKVANPYDYLDYRTLLNDDYLARLAHNHSYSLRAYSRDLDVSPGFLSDVLRGKKDFSPSHSLTVFSKIGFDANETEYIKNLIEFKNSPDPSIQSLARDFVFSKYNGLNYVENDSKDGYLKSIYHFIVYGIVRHIGKFEQLVAFTTQLGISDAQVLKVLTDLCEEGYLTKQDNNYLVREKMLMVRNSERTVFIVKALTDLILQYLDRKGLNCPDRVAHGFILGLNEESFSKASEVIKHTKRQLHRFGEETKNPDRFVFFTETFCQISGCQTLLRDAPRIEDIDIPPLTQGPPTNGRTV